MSGFWIYSFITALLVPLILMLCGYLLYYKTPKKINGFYGYRTKMSRKNQKTWDFANRYCGRVWMLMGSGMLPVSVLCMKLVVDADVDTIGMWNGILVTIQCVIMILAVPLTERALRKNFDAYGIKKNNKNNPDYIKL